MQDNGDNLKDKQEELEAVKVFEAESRLHVKTLRYSFDLGNRTHVHGTMLQKCI